MGVRINSFLLQSSTILLCMAVVGCKKVNPTPLDETEIKSIGDGMDVDLEASIEEIAQVIDENYLDVMPDDPTTESSLNPKPSGDQKPAGKGFSLNTSNLQQSGRTLKRNNELERAKKFISDVKKSLSDVGKSTCKILQPYFRGSHHGMMHPYFFSGFEGNAGAGIIAIAGKEFVWDFYNMQFSSFNYQGFGFTAGSSSLGAEISGYFGMGFGQKADVISAWSGQFQSAGISGSLPILADYLSIGASGFTGLSPSGQADYSIYGASVGGSLSFGVPTAIPVSGAVKQATWTHSKTDNLSVASLMKKGGVKLATSGRETCNDQCIRFDSGDAKASYRSRSQMLIRSIPVLANIRGIGEYFPGFNKVALLALATGVYRDTANAAEVCKKRN